MPAQALGSHDIEIGAGHQWNQTHGYPKGEDEFIGQFDGRQPCHQFGQGCRAGKQWNHHDHVRIFKQTATPNKIPSIRIAIEEVEQGGIPIRMNMKPLMTMKITNTHNGYNNSQDPQGDMRDRVKQECQGDHHQEYRYIEGEQRRSPVHQHDEKLDQRVEPVDNSVQLC